MYAGHGMPLASWGGVNALGGELQAGIRWPVSGRLLSFLCFRGVFSLKRKGRFGEFRAEKSFGGQFCRHAKLDDRHRNRAAHVPFANAPAFAQAGQAEMDLARPARAG
jgi:hypothetical protein